jgi:hypothetical protein
MESEDFRRSPWNGEVFGDLFSMAKLLRFALVGMVIEGRKERTFRWTLMTDQRLYSTPMIPHV